MMNVLALSFAGPPSDLMSAISQTIGSFVYGLLVILGDFIQWISFLFN